MSDLILYTTEDGKSQIQLRADLGKVWLTQLEMAELFDATKQNISLHLKNLFEDGELDAAATVKESLTVQTEGTRKVQRPITLYNLDAILAVGYRVRSPRGAVPPLGVHGAQRVPGQGLCDGRRAAEEPGRPPGLL
jgi:hypothetical protein